MNPDFSYAEAFSRNIGWFTEAEQESLRGKTVAIAGMGGVGGVHLLTMARLGVANFKIADMDNFETANFNRQVGAMMSTIGQAKVEVLAGMVRDINPEAKVELFPRGIDAGNLDAFLEGVDLFIDGFDFFVLDIRCKAFARCRELGIPAVTAAPVGMGVAFLLFAPDGMSFEQYFRLEQAGDKHGKLVRFMVGLTPSLMQRHYLVDNTRMDFKKEKSSSTFIGVEICAAFTGAQVVKILLGRGEVRPVPYHYHFDAYRNQFKRGWQGGNGSLLGRVKCWAVSRIMSRRIEAQLAAKGEVSPAAGR